MVTKWVIFLILLLKFSNYSEVDGVFETVQQVMSLIFPPSTNTEGAHMPLVMTLDRYDGMHLANFPILTNNMWNRFHLFYFFCPAETVEEMKLNKERSQTGNSLFFICSYKNRRINENEVQNINEDLKNGNDEHFKETCHERVEVFVREGETKRDNDVQDFSIGFEIYMYVDKKLLFKPRENHAKLKINEEFNWAEVLCIRFDPVKYNVIIVSNHVKMYYDGVIVVPPRKFLPEDIYKGNNNFGKKEVFKDFDIASAYELGNQEKVFDRLFGSSSSQENPSYFHEIQGRYLVKVHLAPLYGILNPILKRAARTYANIAPMWKTIRENAWFKVENYVNLISQAIPEIDQETGTYGTLALSGKEIHLADEERVRVPLAFWKIIHYTPKRPDECYNIIIVTVNNPYESTPGIICKENQCEKLGWDYVQQDHYSMGLTSCCELTLEILKMIKTYHFFIKEKADFAMNLNAFPHWKSPKLTLNVKKFLEDRINNPTKSVRVDHPSYRNEQGVLLDSEIEEKNRPRVMDEDENDEGILSNILENYVAPIWTFVSENIYSKSSPVNGKSTMGNSA